MSKRSGTAQKPRLLDLFCGAGGAAKGYHDAGFDVFGVDIAPQPHYPFEFYQADALTFLQEMLAARYFDAIHASPPCQAYSRALSHMAAPQPELIEPVRDLLVELGLPWVIENVIGAPLPSMWTLDGRYGLELCGTMFGLRVAWHRLFESNVPLDAPRTSCRCDSVYVLNPHNQAGRDRMYAEFGKGDPEAVWRRERGTEWMGRYEAREAIPPAYTEFIGRQLLTHLRAEHTRRRMGAGALEEGRTCPRCGDLCDWNGRYCAECGCALCLPEQPALQSARVRGRGAPSASGSDVV